MAFPDKVAERALLDSARHCCLCHVFCGTKIELHHIRQKADGGEDTYENCIPLCLNCHAEVKAYNPNHPKGRAYSESELKGHRDRWYAKVTNSGSITVNPNCSELDKNLFLKIGQLLPSNGSISFIRYHNYSGIFFGNRHDDLKRFEEMCDKPEFEFLDIDLEGIRSDLANQISQFLVSVGFNTSPIDGNGERYRVTEEWKNSEEHYQSSKELNQLAESICSTYDNLIRSGRRKLGVDI
jgi:hypothetical protein